MNQLRIEMRPDSAVHRLIVSSNALRRALCAVGVSMFWLACAVPGAFAQQFVSLEPEVKSFKIGDLDVAVLRDDALTIPNDGSVFGVNTHPAAIAKILAKAGVPVDKIRLDVDTLLIRMPGHVILIDAGYGSTGHGIIQRSLVLAGQSPDSVTDILITHAHTDHVGGLVDSQGQPAFRNATIRMSEKEWAYMQSETSTRAESTVIRPQVQTFKLEQAVLPGITPVALYGHTPGHVGYEIASHGYRLVDIGDLVHSSIVSLAKPDWAIAWDADKLKGARLRRMKLSRLAAKHTLIFVSHFPFPGVGWVVQKGNGFTFLPAIPLNN